MDNLDLLTEIQENLLKLFDNCNRKYDCECSEKCILYIDNECKLDRINQLFNLLETI